MILANLDCCGWFCVMFLGTAAIVSLQEIARMVINRKSKKDKG